MAAVSVVGVGVAGYAIGRYTSPSSGAVDVVEIASPVVAANGDQTARPALLVKKLADAEAKIKALEADVDSLLAKDPQEEAPVVEKPREERPRGGRRFGGMSDAEMEKLKTEDPERYAEMVKQREARDQMRQEFMEQRRSSEASRDEFFANVNIAHLSPEEQQSLASFVQDYQELRSLFERREDGAQPDRAKAMQLGMSVMQRSNDIRASLLKATAKEMGFNDEESVQFSGAVNEIFGATSLMGPGGGAMPAMGGGPQGPGR
jgi:hypothetical protein